MLSPATPLRLGDVVEGGLQCGYHGMVFAGDGKCVHIPGQDTINERARVRSFPVVERQEIIWIWMGDPVLADESTILIIRGMMITKIGHTLTAL